MTRLHSWSVAVYSLLPTCKLRACENNQLGKCAAYPYITANPAPPWCRTDLEKAIAAHGGQAVVAAALGWPLKARHRRPNGYWDDLENVRRGIDDFIEEQGMDPGECLCVPWALLCGIIAGGRSPALPWCKHSTNHTSPRAPDHSLQLLSCPD